LEIDDHRRRFLILLNEERSNLQNLSGTRGSLDPRCWPASGQLVRTHIEFRTKSQLIRLIVEECLIKHKYLDGQARRYVA